jgi:hypothetical protein
MINDWRSVEYTDDGCTEYQCLSCKTSWEARTSPEHAHWRFCPVCGIQWTGQLPDNDAACDRAWWRRRQYWTSQNAERSRRLHLPWWRYDYLSNFFPDDGWEPDYDTAPFQGSARTAHHNRKHWHADNNSGKWRLVMVPTTEQFPLP